VMFPNIKNCKKIMSVVLNDISFQMWCYTLLYECWSFPDF
jgi:hypothetical protein